ncbi:hypothetical protein [Candidatus Nitrotoga sp. M5]|uniref:hypothetical protein n=1 Tax=Candidatus Nitrotoga sp. M5 TaxID=2890409 RepID=UPI001EF1F4A3|nr:hypothetical protein [Candidatus Nitrotoga sp. M5]CAH1385483.1 Nucleotidyltransferase [Candidatus Nitrotoga sp. M5]
MPADNYIRAVLAKYAVNVAGAKAAGNFLYPIIQRWAGNFLVCAEFSGSLSKGTAVTISTDADIFISLSSSTPDTLENIYNTLCNAVASAGYPVKRQNVSLGTSVNGFKIDLVPGRRQSPNGNDHSLWKDRSKTWTKTNIQTHIGLVSKSRRLEEIRAVKIWRSLHGIEFPSIHLELVVIEALRNARVGNVASNLSLVLDYLRDGFERARFIDPANTNNIISDDLALAQKRAIGRQAGISRAKPTYDQVIW